MNTTTERSFLVDDDLFEAGLDGYVKGEGSGSNVWRLKTGEPRKGYFLQNPGTPGDWVKYRELSAFEGLRGGVEMPNGLKEFPVYDQVLITDPDTGKSKRTTRPDNDPLIALVVPGKFAKNGKAKASDVMSLNFIEIVKDSETDELTHRHIVLKLSATASRTVLNFYRTQVEMNDGEFDMTAFPWTLTVTGSGSASQLTLKPHRKDGPIDLDEFEPIDIIEMLGTVRAAVEDHVEQIRTGGDATIAAAKDKAEADDGDIQFGNDEDDDDEALSKSDKYAAFTDAKIRKLLKDAGAEVPPKANRPTLISLAVSHLD